MRVVPVDCLQDNYAYLIIDDESRLAAAVDPVEPQKVQNYASVGDPCIMR